jgi:large subunit ribosomal protein L24
MDKIRKNDIVVALAGRDKGKTGKVFRVFPKEGRALVEGLNYVKKHMRRTRSEDHQSGGIVLKESPIRASRLSLFCRTCNKPARIGINVLQDGSKARFCKRCKEAF